MSKLNSVLRAGSVGGAFLGLAVLAAVASNTSAIPVVAGLAVGLALLLVGIRRGQVIPGRRRTDSRAWEAITAVRWRPPA